MELYKYAKGDLMAGRKIVYLHGFASSGRTGTAASLRLLLPGAEEAELQARIAELKKKSALFDNVSFSAGYCVIRSGTDPRKALSEADARMYADKENTYRENPELRRD